jgi:hypothetical protein
MDNIHNCDNCVLSVRKRIVQNFVDRGLSRGQRGGHHTAVNLSFLDRSHYFFYQVGATAFFFQLATHLSLRG